MNVEEICAEASALSQADRSQLVERLLVGLGSSDYDVSDEEILQRIKETKTGEVADISHEEFLSGLDHLKAS